MSDNETTAPSVASPSSMALLPGPAKTALLSTLLSLTLLSNVFSIAAIRARARKISRMYYFLLHLSVADALTALLTLAPELVWTLQQQQEVEEEEGGADAASPGRRWESSLGAEALCKSVKFFQMLAPYLR